MALTSMLPYTAGLGSHRFWSPTRIHLHEINCRFLTGIMLYPALIWAVLWPTVRTFWQESIQWALAKSNVSEISCFNDVSSFSKSFSLLDFNVCAHFVATQQYQSKRLTKKFPRTPLHSFAIWLHILNPSRVGIVSHQPVKERFAVFQRCTTALWWMVRYTTMVALGGIRELSSIGRYLFEVASKRDYKKVDRSRRSERQLKFSAGRVD